MVDGPVGDGVVAADDGRAAKALCGAALALGIDSFRAPLFALRAAQVAAWRTDVARLTRRTSALPRGWCWRRGRRGFRRPRTPNRRPIRNRRRRRRTNRRWIRTRCRTSRWRMWCWTR